MNGGKPKLVLVSTSSHKGKRDTSKKPRMLTKSEIESLRIDLKESYKAFSCYDRSLMEA